MTPQSNSDPENALICLAWDSSHFGFDVGAITCPDLHDSELDNVLRRARESGIAMVYWMTRPGRDVPTGLLGAYGGSLVDRKVCYARQLFVSPTDKSPEFAPIKDSPYWIEEFPVGPATDTMVSLAAAAGCYSRYRRDTRFPAAISTHMYTTWIERSTRREIADMVFHATNAQGYTAGMITLTNRDGACQIGLVAVDAAVRRAGIGKSLLEAAHRWSLEHNIFRSKVVTQAENLPACRLYENCGYFIHESNDVYHFWPL